jgi:hypothetical protein
MNRRRVALLLLAILFLGNSGALGDDMAETQPDFFPKGAFGDYSNVDDIVRKWYIKQLRGLEETSLYPPSTDKEVYRFTWLRTFHNPMVFKITVLGNGSGTLTVKRANGAGGYEPGLIDLRKDIALSNAQVDELKKGLSDMSYWEKPSKLETMGMDGAQWIVEANANGKYKIVDRWSGSDPAVQAWGIQLIDLSGADVGDVY